MAGRIRRVLLAGCEPTPLQQSVEIQSGLSRALAAAVSRAIDMLESIATNKPHNRNGFGLEPVGAGILHESSRRAAL
jgi:hypothetical protein